MPYKRKGKCVYKKTGKKVGCSKTPAKAKRYLKKLYTLPEHIINNIMDRGFLQKGKTFSYLSSVADLIEESSCHCDEENESISLRELIDRELYSGPNTEAPYEYDDEDPYIDDSYDEEQEEQKESPLGAALQVSAIPKDVKTPEIDRLRTPAKQVIQKTGETLMRHARR